MKFIMLRDVMHALFDQPVTEQYPFEQSSIPDRLRGRLHWSPERCTGCSLCVKDCPANAIRLITLDKANKRFVMEYHTDRCVYCAQCVQNCRFNCLELVGDEWELAAANRDSFLVYYGSAGDVETVVAGEPAPDDSCHDK